MELNTLASMDLNILLWGRVVERLVIAVAGFGSLWMGWHLFKSGVLDSQTASARSGEHSISLDKVGPGAFFALFGAAVLVYSIATNLNALEVAATPNAHGQDDPAPGQYVSYLGPQENQLRVCQSITTCLSAPSSEALLDYPQAEQIQIRKARVLLKSLRRTVAIGVLGPELVRDYDDDPESLDEESRSAVKAWLATPLD